jgi:serine/threonine-protein kinase
LGVAQGGGDPEAAAGVREGQILAGKYRVERILGVGGMGVVVAAYNIQLDTRVALKFLLPDVLLSEEAVARFTREARAAARIQSEHVARVHDVGTLENGAPYMVMEFLEGVDLAKWLQEWGPLPTDQAVDFILQGCVALADAHALGIVHRDLKPANLFCVRRTDGQFLVKVLDFGISKLTDLAHGSNPPGVNVTKTATVMGTPLYMSPEQAQSAKDVDARTDIWALGVILFQLLTGTVPFTGEAFGELAVKISTAPTPSLRAYRPDVPPALDGVVGTCLEKARSRRFPSVAELAQALLPFAPKSAVGSVQRITGILRAAGLSKSGESIAPSSPVRTETVVAPGSVSAWSDATTATSRKASRMATVGALGALGLVLAAAVTVFAVFHRTWLDGAHGGAPFAGTSAPSHAATTVSIPASAAVATAAIGLVGLAPSTDPTPSTTVTASALPGITAPPRASATEQGSTPTPPIATIPSPPHPSSAPAQHPSAPQTSPSCDPNYYLDSHGEKRFKPECFGVTSSSTKRK